MNFIKKLILSLTLLTGFAFGQQVINGGGGNSAFNGGAPGTSFQDVTEIAAPSNPAAGVERWYANSTSHVFTCLTSSGGSCNPTAAAGGANTDILFNAAGAQGGIAQWTTNGTTTITGSSTAVLNMSAMSPTAGLDLPTAAGAAPTADGFIAVNSTNHTLVSGSNGTTIVQAAAGTGTNVSTTCTNQFVNVISAIAAPTCASVTLASAQFANQGTTTTVLHGNAAGNPSFSAVNLANDVTGSLVLTSLATQIADSVVQNATGGVAAPTAVAIPSCSGGSNALIYNTTTHTWGCNTITGTAFSSGAAGSGYQDVTEIAAPANPSAGVDRLYTDSGSHTFKCLTSAGGSCLPAGGTLTSSGPPTANQLPYFTTSTNLASITLPVGDWLVSNPSGGAPIAQVKPVFDIRDCTVSVCGAVAAATADFGAAINNAQSLLGSGYIIDATNPGAFASTGVAITSISETSTTVTALTATTPVNGSMIGIMGYSGSSAGFNGSFQVTGVTPGVSFTYTDTGGITAGGAGNWSYCGGASASRQCVFSNSDINQGVIQFAQSLIKFGNYNIVLSVPWTTPAGVRDWEGLSSQSVSGSANPTGTVFVAAYAGQANTATYGPSANPTITTTPTLAAGGPFLDASPYSTGTVEVCVSNASPAGCIGSGGTANNPVVIGSGTTFTSSMAGGYFTSCGTNGSPTTTCPNTANASSAVIKTFNSTTSLTLYPGWNGSTATTGLVFTIYHPTIIPMLNWGSSPINQANTGSSFGSILKDVFLDLEGLPSGDGLYTSTSQEGDRYNHIKINLNAGIYDNGSVATNAISACYIFDRSFNAAGVSGPSHYTIETAFDCSIGSQYVASSAGTAGYSGVVESWDIIRAQFGDGPNSEFLMGTVTGKANDNVHTFHDCGYYDGVFRFRIIGHCEFDQNGLEIGKVNGAYNVIVQDLSEANETTGQGPEIHFYSGVFSSRVDNVSTPTNSRVIVQDDSTGGQTLTADSGCPDVSCNPNYYQPTEIPIFGGGFSAAGQSLFTGNSIANVPELQFKGTVFTGGTSSSTVPFVLFGTTGHAIWSTSGTLIGGDLGSSFVGNIFDFHTGAGLTPPSVFKLDTSGNLTASTSVNTGGSNGGISGTEGTGASLTAGAGTDLQFADSTNHCWHLNTNNTDIGCSVAGGTAAVTSGDLVSWNGTSPQRIQDAGIVAANVTTNSVSGTTNAIPKFSAAHTITNSTISDNATLISTTEGISVAPTSTSQVSGIFNNPTSTSVDILDLQVAASNKFTFGNTGILTTLGSTAGVIDFAQGSTNAGGTPCTVATSICEQAPTAVTSYTLTKPGTAAQGIKVGTLSGSTITEGISGDANHSAVVVTGSGTSIGSTSLCSTTFCPAGTYRVNVYIDITTACGTTGTYIVNLIYTDDQGSKTIPVNINGTGAVPATGILTTTSTANFGENSQIIRSTGGASINYSTTATSCGTAGPMVGKLYLSVEPVQ